MIKEIEGLLAEEEEVFIIGRPSGYGINSRSSTGLEPNNVALWPMRTAAVFFVSETDTEIKRGQTYTPLEPGIKVVYLRIVMDEKEIDQPYIQYGVMTNFVKKSPPKKYPEKFEHLMGHLEYQPLKLPDESGEFDYQHPYIQFRGQLLTTHLFDLHTSQDIQEKIIQPALELYRNV